MTHNNSECHKYKKNGTLKKGFSGKAAIGQKCHVSGKKNHANSIAQIRNTATLVIPTQNRIMGTVVLWDPVATKI